MLNLTRRPGETIVMTLPSGETIRITVLNIKGNQVRIGTDAPNHIAVDRQEIYERKRQGPPAPREVRRG